MASISGMIYWAGELPDDDDVENSQVPSSVRDANGAWQYVATEPVIRNLCEALHCFEFHVWLCVGWLYRLQH